MYLEVACGVWACVCAFWYSLSIVLHVNIWPGSYSHNTNTVARTHTQTRAHVSVLLWLREHEEGVLYHTRYFYTNLLFSFLFCVVFFFFSFLLHDVLVFLVVPTLLQHLISPWFGPSGLHAPTRTPSTPTVPVHHFRSKPPSQQLLACDVSSMATGWLLHNTSRQAQHRY